MNTNRRTNQGGSVAVFLIVATLLSAAVIGGAYAIQKRGAHVRTNEPIAQQTDASKQKTGEQASKQQTDDEKKKADAEAAKQAEDKKAQEQKVAAEKKAEAQKQADAAKQAAADAEKKRAQQQAVIPQTSTAPTTGNLPQTGPSDAFPEFIGAAILLGVLIAYLKSYRHRFGSLLR